MPPRDDNFDHLDVAGRAMAAVSARPGRGVWLVMMLLVATGWFVVLAMARDVASSAPLTAGPGAALLDMLPDLPLPPFVERLVGLCMAPSATGAAPFVALAAMWFLMSVAMMLPSAAPLVRTYCEIADTARARGEAVAHPLLLVAGYLAVWLAAACAFAAVTLVLAGRGGALDPLRGAAAAAALALAGLYQFSRLKEACLRKCGNPFATLFARWSAKPAKILRLGVEQGLWCLGCCWALMLVMFAVGIMNPFWMALLALFAIAEKHFAHPLPSRLAGGLLLVWAAALLVVSR